MNKILIAKSALALGVLMATMPAAEARVVVMGGGFRTRIVVGPTYGPWGYGYPGYYGGYPGVGLPVNSHPNAGQVKLDTKQKDAKVFIDGAYAGTAKEMKATWLPQGTHDLKIRAADGEKFESEVYVASGKTIHIHPQFG